MNAVLKNAIFVASGALIGALGGYYACERVLSEKFEEEVREYKKSYDKHVKDLEETVKSLSDAIDIYEAVGVNFTLAKEIADKNKKAVEKSEKDIIDELNSRKSKYINYAKVPTDEKEEVQDPPKDIDPYVISYDQYYEENENYDKVVCTLYMADEVLCESARNEPIDILNVGRDVVSMFEKGDMDIIYVRNDKIHTDYEIDKYDGSFALEVLGEDLEE